MKLDPYRHKEMYEKWKLNPNNPNVSKANNNIIQNYIFDMEIGKNVSRFSPKGTRSHIRLNKSRQKIFFICELLEKHTKVMNVTKVTEDQMHKLFNDMRTGKIRKINGGIYKSTGDYVRVFKAFWHWHQKVSSKKIKDITEDLDTREETPEFIYFTEEELNDMLKLADPDMKVLMVFLFDTGMRVTEMKNIKVSDFLNDFKEVKIREETAKTFGRRIKLMMCSDVVRNYIDIMDLKSDNFVFKLHTSHMNKRLKKIGKNALAKEGLTLYDFRHSSACFWYPRYPNIQGLLYRFGWKKIEMAHYYARFLGMEDTISEGDLLLGVTKTELEKEMIKMKKELEHFKEAFKMIWEGKTIQYVKNKVNYP